MMLHLLNNYKQHEIISKTENYENFIKNFGEWRSSNPSIIRKVGFGLAALVTGLTALIDTIASLALAILTSPLEFAGIKLSTSFMIRASRVSIISATCLTFLQFMNIAKQIQ